MPASPRYLQLKGQLDCLRACFLPDPFDPTGTYASEVYLRARAYRVLAHAEFESYLEDRVWEVALEAVKVWNSHKRVTVVTLSLLAFSGQQMELPPDEIKPQGPGQTDAWKQRIDITCKLERAIGSLRHTIDHNHGIKEENLMRLLIPIGVGIDKIDSVLVATMNSFGERRGNAAHTTGATQTQEDPKGELDTVSQILEGIRQLDSEIQALYDCTSSA